MVQVVAVQAYNPNWKQVVYRGAPRTEWVRGHHAMWREASVVTTAPPLFLLPPGPNPLADMDSPGPYPLADLDPRGPYPLADFYPYPRIWTP